MSYTIEYNRKVYRVPGDYGAVSYLLLARRGDNNVFGSDGLRCKDWYLDFFGDVSDFWPHVGRNAGHCHGGGLQRAVGWMETKYISVEEYIAIYRKAFWAAKPITDIFSDFEVTLNVVLRGDKEKAMLLSDCHGPERAAALDKFFKEKGGSLSLSQNWYGNKTSEGFVVVKDLEGFREALQLKGRVSSLVEGFGGTVRIDFEAIGMRRRRRW